MYCNNNNVITKATGDQADIAKAESLWSELGGSGAYPSEVSWDDKWAMTFLLMFDITGKVAHTTHK